MRSREAVAIVVTGVLMVLAATMAAQACPVCYGAADSQMTEGTNLAILSLLGITSGVLASFIAFFVYLRRRARLLKRRFADMMN